MLCSHFETGPKQESWMASRSRKILIAPQWRDTAINSYAAKEINETAPDQVITLLGQRIHKLIGLPHATTVRPALIGSPGQLGISASETPIITRQSTSGPAPANHFWSESLPQAHAIACTRSWASPALLSLLQQQACILEDPSLVFTLEAVQDMMSALPVAEPRPGARLDAAAVSLPSPAGPVQLGSLELLLQTIGTTPGCSLSSNQAPGGCLFDAQVRSVLPQLNMLCSLSAFESLHTVSNHSETADHLRDNIIQFSGGFLASDHCYQNARDRNVRCSDRSVLLWLF